MGEICLEFTQGVQLSRALLKGQAFKQQPMSPQPHPASH